MRLLATVAILACVVLQTPIALSHPADDFDACVTSARRGQACRNAVVVLAGDSAFVKGRIRPRHAGQVASVRRLAPHASSWRQVGTALVHEKGGIRWQWVTLPGDAHPFTSWRFRFALPAHGWSDVVRVRVVPPDV
jgi:hypothetical protein